MQQPLKQALINPAAEPDLAVDFDHRDALVVLGPQFGNRVDIDLPRGKPITHQDRFGVITKVTTLPSIKDNLWIRHGGHTPKMTGLLQFLTFPA